MLFLSINPLCHWRLAAWNSGLGLKNSFGWSWFLLKLYINIRTNLITNLLFCCIEFTRIICKLYWIKFDIWFNHHNKIVLKILTCPTQRKQSSTKTKEIKPLKIRITTKLSSCSHKPSNAILMTMSYSPIDLALTWTLGITRLRLRMLKAVWSNTFVIFLGLIRHGVEDTRERVPHCSTWIE